MKTFKHRQSGNTVSLIYILAVVGSSLNKKDKHFTWDVGNIARTLPAKIQEGVMLIWRAEQWEQWEMSFDCSQAGMVLRSRIFGENIVCRHAKYLQILNTTKHEKGKQRHCRYDHRILYLLLWRAICCGAWMALYQQALFLKSKFWGM